MGWGEGALTLFIRTIEIDVRRGCEVHSRDDI